MGRNIRKIELRTPGALKPKVVLTGKSIDIYRALVCAGYRGITTKEWPGWDLRHFIRVLRGKGLQIERQWEKHDGGQHGRWRLIGTFTEKQI